MNPTPVRTSASEGESPRENVFVAGLKGVATGAVGGGIGLGVLGAAGRVTPAQAAIAADAIQQVYPRFNPAHGARAVRGIRGTVATLGGAALGGVVGGVSRVVRNSMRPEAPKTASANYYTQGYEAACKLAFEPSIGMNIPGTPINISAKPSQQERWPGMTRWVDRSVMERAMDAHAAGVSSAQFADSERSQNRLRDVGVGAALGGAMAGGVMLNHHKPRSLLHALAIGGGAAAVGAGVGLGVNALGASDRAVRGAEAYKGAVTSAPERRFSQKHVTAREPVAKVLR